jgi:hypothetical protein
MKAFLATVLSVIAVGVLLIAYGLFNPRVGAVEAYQSARPMLASERVGLIDERYARRPTIRRMAGLCAGLCPGARPAMAYPVNNARAVPVVYETAPAPEPRRVYRRAARRAHGASQRRTRAGPRLEEDRDGHRRLDGGRCGRRRHLRRQERARSSAPRSAAAQGRFTRSGSGRDLGTGDWGPQSLVLSP